MRTALLFALLGLSVCRAQPEAVVQPPADEALVREEPPIEDVPKMHLALRGPGTGWAGEIAPSGTLCPIRGRTFVCGLPALLYVDGPEITGDAALDAGRIRDNQGALAGAPFAMAGSWPDDAWLVEVTAWGNPTVPYRVYHWAGDRWTLRTTFDAVQVEALASAKGLLVERAVYDEMKGTIHRRELVSKEGGARLHLLESRMEAKVLATPDVETVDAGAPAEHVKIVSYARENPNIEWAVGAQDGYPHSPNTVWRRTSGGAWESVELLRLAPKIEPQRVWAVGGEVWLLVFYEAKDDFAALFRTGAVGRVREPPG